MGHLLPVRFRAEGRVLRAPNHRVWDHPVAVRSVELVRGRHPDYLVAVVQLANLDADILKIGHDCVVASEQTPEKIADQFASVRDQLGNITWHKQAVATAQSHGPLEPHTCETGKLFVH